MKKFLIFVLGFLVGGLVVYCFFPNTVKSQKEAAGYMETIDSLEHTGKRLVENPNIAGHPKVQIQRPATREFAGEPAIAQSPAAQQQPAAQSKPRAEQPATQQQPAAQSKPQAGQPKQTTQTTENLGKKYFENAVGYGGRKSFQVNKVLESGDALAEEVAHVSEITVITDYNSKVLLECDPEMPYYDSQVVQASEGKKVLQLGIYRYKENKHLDAKTVPIIAIR